ncbi:hypothetical protein MXD61_16770 [Frankia sp. AgPm24]|uniref:hypothetical protein n=1 Tax=Frankia sp. AgPm24 TaxID=631128 RepID=UPI00200E133F|nr:hypothetical protein [Frankia sp. AgPm24]MCK9923500.1 hypothetical protein [Frankia sp. AgPm24]
MGAHLQTAEDGPAALVMFARGDRVFPIDDLGGGIWSRRGTVLAVHPAGRRAPSDQTGSVRVEVSPAAAPLISARATVLWDDGSAEVLDEAQLCLVYDQEAPVGVRVVTVPMAEPVDVVQHGGHVVLVLRDGLLPPAALDSLRDKLRRVRAALTPAPAVGSGRPADEATAAAAAAERRRRDLDLLRALIAQLTGGPADRG